MRRGIDHALAPARLCSILLASTPYPDPNHHATQAAAITPARPGQSPDSALSRYGCAVRLRFRGGEFRSGGTPRRPGQGGRPGDAGELALAGSGIELAAQPATLVRLAGATTAAALCHPDGASGKPVLHHPVLCHHHHLEQRASPFHRPARRCRAGFADRSAVLQMAGTTALGLPRLSRADPVRRPADRSADHPSSVHPAELSAGAGGRSSAGPAEPQWAVSPLELAHVARHPVAGGGAGRRRLVGPDLGSPGNPVADRRSRDHEPR